MSFVEFFLHGHAQINELGTQNRAMLFVRLLHAVVLCGPSELANQSENTRPRFLRSFSA